MQATGAEVNSEIVMEDSVSCHASWLTEYLLKL
jgi:hypothetical protein